MPTFIVCTNFSDTSRNALSYTCSLIGDLAKPDETTILLLHVYTIPANYSGDGIALTTIDTAIQYSEDDLHEELVWAHDEFPSINIIGKLTAGRLLDGLKEQITEFAAGMVMLGTGGNYGDLWSWDSNIVNVLNDLPVPVITIPPKMSYTPLKNIALACNLKNFNRATRLKTIVQFAESTGAKLDVVYVTSHPANLSGVEESNKQFVEEALGDIQPTYHTLPETEVVGAIGRYATDNNIQLLIVMPRKQGIWESLFRKSYTKELTRLNKLPIMALH